MILFLFCAALLPLATASSSSSSSSLWSKREIQRAIRVGDSSAVSSVLSSSRFDASVLNEYYPDLDNSSLLMAVMQKSHAALERLQGSNARDVKTSREEDERIFQLLLRAGASPHFSCPLLDAAIYRDMSALRSILSRLNASELQDCLTVQFSNGEGLMHSLASSKSAGFSRIFMRLSRAPDWASSDAWRLLRRSTGMRKTPNFAAAATASAVSAGGGDSTLSKSEIDDVTGTEDLHLVARAIREQGAHAAVLEALAFRADIEDASHAHTPIMRACMHGTHRALKTLLELQEEAEVAVRRKAEQEQQQQQEGQRATAQVERGETAPPPTTEETLRSCIRLAGAYGYSKVLQVIENWLNVSLFCGREGGADTCAALRQTLMRQEGEDRGASSDPFLSTARAGGPPPDNSRGPFSLARHLRDGWRILPISTLQRLGLRETLHLQRPALVCQPLQGEEGMSLMRRNGTSVSTSSHALQHDGDVIALPPSGGILRCKQDPAQFFSLQSDSQGDRSVESSSSAPSFSIPLPQTVDILYISLDATDEDVQRSILRLEADLRPFIIRRQTSSLGKGSSESDIRLFQPITNLVVSSGARPYASSYGLEAVKTTVGAFIREQMGRHHQEMKNKSDTEESSSSSSSSNDAFPAWLFEEEATDTQQVAAANTTGQPLQRPLLLPSLLQYSETLEKVGASVGPGSETPYPPYVFDGTAFFRVPEARKWLKSLPGSSHVKNHGMEQLILGPAGSGAQPHYHGKASNALIFGMKLWAFMKPAKASFADTHALPWFLDHFHPAFGGNRSFYDTPDFIALQEPGDVVHVPEHFGHAVLNMADSFALAVE